MWDIVAEIVKLCTYPAPRNPFAIDFEYFNMLPLSEQVLATAAMVNLLQKILIHTPDQKVYAGQGRCFLIMKTCPCNKQIVFALKIENFQLKTLDIFLILAQNIGCGYTLELPQ